MDTLCDMEKGMTGYMMLMTAHLPYVDVDDDGSEEEETMTNSSKASSCASVAAAAGASAVGVAFDEEEDTYNEYPLVECENCGNRWDGYAQCTCWNLVWFRAVPAYVNVNEIQGEVGEENKNA
jgi:hypothetical protein